jgi:hypothetical protein
MESEPLLNRAGPLYFCVLYMYTTVYRKEETMSLVSKYRGFVMWRLLDEQNRELAEIFFNCANAPS